MSLSVPGASSLSLVSLETETTGCVGALAASTTLTQASPKHTLLCLVNSCFGEEEKKGKRRGSLCFGRKGSLLFPI